MSLIPLKKNTKGTSLLWRYSGFLLVCGNLNIKPEAWSESRKKFTFYFNPVFE